MEPVTSEQPLISVIITCFNYARYVAGAIESALGQSYPNKEIVVVNDGSSDDSLAVITRYAGRVTVIDQANQGSIAAYNRGFAGSTGAIVILLDADDLLAAGALSEVARVWSPRCAKVQWDLGIIDADGKDLGRKFCNFDRRYDAGRVRDAFQRTGTYRWPVSVGNAYARWFASMAFPLSVDHGPDGLLNTLAPVYGEVHTIASVLGHYRIHGGNLWSSSGSDFSRLPYRIEHRLTEIATMQRHATERGVPLPNANPLDHEIAFINYRLMAKKLGLEYAGSGKDSASRLVGCAYRVLRAERYPPKLSFAHGAWFGLLAIAPKPLARALIRLRFQRSSLGPAFREALGSVLRTTRSRTSSSRQSSPQRSTTPLGQSNAEPLRSSERLK